MKTNANYFKNNINKLGRQLSSRITYTLNGETIELGNDKLNSISPSYETSLLKSVMKYIEIDSNENIPLNTVFKYELGLKVGNEYKYLNFGNYVVKEVEIQEDTNSYLIKAYDKMLYSMIDYEPLNITYPITIRNYINAICNKLGITFANANDTFANYNKEIPNEIFLTNDNKSLGYTFRDVLDQLAEVTASNICINEDDELEIRYFTNTNDTIDETYLKNINVKFGKSFGPVNTIVLSRSAGADNIHYPSTLPENPIEIKISDNQIMNANDRDTYMPAIYNVLNGLEFYINDFDSTGICYYDVCDKYNVSIGEETYNCIMLNDSIEITQGLSENIYTDEPEETNTDYTKADKTDQRINQTTLIVNKQEGEIQALASKIVDLSDIAEDNGTITLENAHEGILHKLEIRGNMSLVYPNDSTKYGEPVIISDDLIVNNNQYISSGVPYENDTLYPSTTLYPKDTYLQVDDRLYKLDFDYLNYMNETTYDKWIYQDGKQWIERNVGIDSNGNMYALVNTIIEQKSDIDIYVESESTITLLSFASSILKCEYLLENEYTDNFATEAYVNSEIKETANAINLKVEAKVDENEIISQINLAVEDKQGIIDLKGNTVTIESDNFTLDETGHIGATAGDIGGFQLTSNNFNNNISGIYDYSEYDVNMLRNYLLGNLTQNATAIKVNDASDDGILNSADLVVMRNIILGNRENTKVIDGKFVINSDNPKNCVQILDSDNNASVSMGVGGVNAVVLTGRNLVIENPEEYNSDAPHYVTIDEAGTIKATSSVSASSFVNTSLASEKKNFKKLDKALDIIKEADIYSYNWKDEEKRNAKKHYGLVIGKDYKTPEEFISNDGKGIDLYATISICLQAIKEQQEQIDELKKDIDLLKEEKNGKDKLYK